jgi:hypothetical protein
MQERGSRELAWVSRHTAIQHKRRARHEEIHSKTTSRMFDATPETMTAKFAGANIRQSESGIEADIADYIEKLTFPLEQSWKHFASFRAKLA